MPKCRRVEEFVIATDPETPVLPANTRRSITQKRNAASAAFARIEAEALEAQAAASQPLPASEPEAPKQPPPKAKVKPAPKPAVAVGGARRTNKGNKSKAQGGRS